MKEISKIKDGLNYKMQFQTSLSKEKYKEYNLFRLHIKGGLENEDRTQIIEGYFYPSAEGKTDKIVFKQGIGSIRQDYFIEKPSSLRFDQYQQLKGYIFHATKASIILAKRQKIITIQNKKEMLRQDIEALESFYNEATI